MSSNSTHYTRHFCTQISPECPVEDSTYGYYPNLGVNSFFIALFGLCLFAQLFLGVWRRTWTYLVVVGIGCFGEAVGYIGRIIMHHNPWSPAGFKTQICCLVLAPSFLAAGIYVTLKHVVIYCGPEHSRLRPNLYPWIFIGCDFGSIVLQAIGGGTAAAAGSQGQNKKLLKAGDDLIVAGIAFQVATMAVCGVLVLDYFLRFQKAKKTKSEAHLESEYEKNATQGKASRNFRIFCIAMGLAFLTIFIRCIYRLPEMAGGWGNKLMQNEHEFLLLDGMMVGIASVLMTIFHPGFFFEPMRRFKK
ncbi:RTA1 like protein-domain-containing protein [Exophiala viscosa]|uniref:RTA1 like protein-domain-containing protein n=1 Tax=Exophiala viscosa TaxID=2486360 RepID=A0AAN6II66_9EURO|nr:RTA1 like protein-domain-containing protein [Exophiala viscosa]KAI1628158.1 RTA1 like protein-domain-containing protein [Exophiala viscosa]